MTDNPSSLLGDGGLGWGMLGGDGPSSAPPTSIDRTVSLSGTSDLEHVGSDRSITLHGTSGVTNLATAIDRTITLHGTGAMRITVDRTNSVVGEAALSGQRSLSYTLHIPADAARTPSNDAVPQLTTSMPTYYT